MYNTNKFFAVFAVVIVALVLAGLGMNFSEGVGSLTGAATLKGNEHSFSDIKNDEDLDLDFILEELNSRKSSCRVVKVVVGSSNGFGCDGGALCPGGQCRVLKLDDKNTVSNELHICCKGSVVPGVGGAVSGELNEGDACDIDTFRNCKDGFCDFGTGKCKKYCYSNGDCSLGYNCKLIESSSTNGVCVSCVDDVQSCHCNSNTDCDKIAPVPDQGHWECFQNKCAFRGGSVPAG